MVLFTIHSQTDTRYLSAYDVANGSFSYLQPDELEHITWISDTLFLYVRNDSLFSQPVKGNSRLTATLKDLNSGINSSETLSYFPEFYYYNNTITYISGTKLYVYNLIKKSRSIIYTFSSVPKNIEPSPAVFPLAYTIGNNLFLVTNEGKQIAVTNETNTNIISGQVVSRNEFGIEHGSYWSPNGNCLAYYCKDVTDVTGYPLITSENEKTVVTDIKYPIAGTDNEKVSLKIINFRTNNTVTLKINDFDDLYITCVTWDPSEESIYAGILNRDQDHLDFNKYDITTGEKINTLFEEENEKYVEPAGPALFIKSNPSRFLWLSRRDGYNHIYLYDTSGKLINQVTRGDWEVTGIHGTNRSGNYVFYTATRGNPMERHVFLTDMTEMQTVKLTGYGGMHNSWFSPDGKYFVDQFNEYGTPTRTFLMNSTGKMMSEIFTATNPLKDYKMGERIIGTIKAADDMTDLYYRLIKPVDFDSTKKYPVILLVYGGPHIQLVQDEWPDKYEIWLQSMAQKGYIGFTLDSRGSSARGFDFESVIYRNLGQNEMKDQVKGIEFLKQFKWVDESRIGVHGWSFGGFMTISLMLNYPEMFKTGVAGGGVTDWKLYEIMYGERYMDTPGENPEGYSLTCVNNKVKQLKGKLLIIHGGVDTVVVEQNGRKFVNECIHNNVPVDYFIYHEHAHHVVGYDRRHLIEKLTLYFEENL